jgi:flavodoxin
MKTLIIYSSLHHGNTKKVAEAMADALEAGILSYDDVDAYNIVEYDLVGFGSGIYHGKPQDEFVEFIESLPAVKNRKAFVFTTSGKGKDEYNDQLKETISTKGFEVVGSFSCRGFDTWGPLKIIGGKNKGQPNSEDLENARNFVKSLKDKF